MEKILYEAKPFLCIGLAAYVLLLPHPSTFLIVCSLLLLALGAVILRARMKARSKGRGLELFLYEAQPFLYIAIAAYALATERHSKLAVISSVILFLCAGIILKWRAEHRK